MPRKKLDRDLSLVVTLNVSGTPWIEYGGSLCGGDYAADLRSKDLVRTLRLDESGQEEQVSSWAGFVAKLDKPLEHVGLHSPNGTSKQLDLLLKELDEKVTPTCSLLIDGFRITGEQFRRLTAQFERLMFVRCHFARGWWLPKSAAKCKSLTLESCSGAEAPTNRACGAGWHALRTLEVRGASPPMELRRGGIYTLCYDANRDLTEPFARDAIAVFWGEHLIEVDVNDQRSVDFLTSLPNLKSLTWMCLRSSVSPSVFEWAARNSNLRMLDLAWRPDVRLPWSELKRLKRLSFLDVSYSPLDDADVQAIVQFSKLQTLRTYYSNATPASWPVVLSWSCLRSFWGSMEMSGDEEPEGLPETTHLKLFIAMNARTEWFEQLLSRYPQVRIFQM